jgi:dienelactone hydrolase
MKRALPVILAALLATSALGDVVVLSSGKKLLGGVCRDDESGVVLNPHNSRNPGMIFEIRTIPRERVKEVIREEPPFRHYLRRSLALAPDDVEGRLELARWCEEQKLKNERLLVLLEALRIDPGNEAALKEYGPSRVKKVAKGNPDLDPAIRAAVDEYLEIGDPAERKTAYGRMKRQLLLSRSREYLDRVIRSRGQPRGLTKDRSLTLRATESPGVYTIFVPKGYDPRRAWPLVLGLHGGGVGGKDRDAVVGSGPSAMNFYVGEAAARGYLVVCPTALAAPWASTPNEAFLQAVLEEVQLLYHVDLNRVYLTGHSMGGFGAWHYGPKWAEIFAAVSPMAGGGGGANRLVTTNTPVFVFHGADDNVVGPSSDRAAARNLAKTGHDYIYTELTGVGHGFPASIRKDLFDFFDTRRLARMRGSKGGQPSAEVRSSFLGKVSRDEKRYLGDPLEYGATGEGDKSEWKRLLRELKLGGGKAEAAATRLGEIKDSRAVKPLSTLVRNPAVADDVKSATRTPTPDSTPVSAPSITRSSRRAPVRWRPSERRSRERRSSPRSGTS